MVTWVAENDGDVDDGKDDVDDDDGGDNDGEDEADNDEGDDEEMEEEDMGEEDKGEKENKKDDEGGEEAGRGSTVPPRTLTANALGSSYTVWKSEAKNLKRSERSVDTRNDILVVMTLAAEGLWP